MSSIFISHNATISLMGSKTPHIKALISLAQGSALSELIRALHPVPGELYLVGGTVRDVVLNNEPADLDLASKLPPEETAARCSKIGLRVIETGIQHGTLTVLSAGHSVEITTFRKAGVRNISAFSETIGEDLSGRDFTINAIAFDVVRNELVDPFGGVHDLQAKILRAVGEPHSRFAEDPLRLLRLVRFGPAADRVIEAQTKNAAAECSESINSVSPERIRVELEKILLSTKVREAFRFMSSSGLLQHILPEMLPSIKCEQNEFHTEDVFEHTLSVVERAPVDRIVRLAALFHDFGKPHTLSIGEDGRRHFYSHEDVSEKLAKIIMTRLKFSNDDIESVAQLVKLHMRPLDCGAPGVRRLLRDLGPRFTVWRDLKVADAPPIATDTEMNELLQRFDSLVEVERNRVIGSPFSNLAITGSDILALGVPEGPEIGKLLKELQEIVLSDPDKNTFEQLSSHLRLLILSR